MMSLSDIAATMKGQAQAGAKILVVEDNDILRQGMQLLLEADGFVVLSANNGLSALEQVRKNVPDLILSDISMPEMDGFRFFEAVRSCPEWVTIPFVFLTARGGRDDIFEGKRLGAEDYLIKPINRQELLATIRSRLARSQELLFAQLQQAYEASLIMLSNAIELRDRYTRGHVERVMYLSLSIGRQMGMSTSQLTFLQFGSILHDIGKIYIGSKVLSKPGPLDADEWEEMKRHPIVGADLVKNIPFLAPTIPVIRFHHERWDGTGYPDALSGDSIPLGARIVAVADSLDAMTTVRVYKGAIAPDAAFRELQEGSGSRYDPDVIRATSACWNTISSKLGSD
jgi:putative two-component system response regulator